MSDNLYCLTTLKTGESDMHGAKGAWSTAVVPAVTKMTHLGLSLMNQADATLPTTTLLKGWLEVLDEKTSFRGLFSVASRVFRASVVGCKRQANNLKHNVGL